MSYLKKNCLKNKNGFSLIEILVVISIMGFLATMAFYSFSVAKIKGRDTSRLSDMAQMQKAIDLYYDNNGFYPKITHASTNNTNCGDEDKWCDLENELKPYISRMPRDPLGLQISNKYYYDSNSEDNYQSYGLMASLESSSNRGLQTSDGGYYDEYYEVGPQPTFCKKQYNINWYNDSSLVCEANT